MADLSFLMNQPIGGLQVVRFGDRNVHEYYHELTAAISDRCGEDTAWLFAEPSTSRDPSTGAPAIAWHSKYGGSPDPIVDLDYVARTSMIKRLRAKLTRLTPLFADPYIGPILASWTNIRDITDFVRVGREPVIVNWGLLTSQDAASRESRIEHFQSMFADLVPDLLLALPPFEDKEFANFQVPKITKPAKTEIYGSAQMPEKRNVQPSEQTPSPPNHTPRIAWWLAPLLATAIASGVLWVLHLPGVLETTEIKSAQAAIDQELAMQEATNGALRDRLRQLQIAARDHSCKMPGQDDPTRNLLPPSPQKLEVTLPPNASTVGGATQVKLSDFIDHTTVLVLATNSEGTRAGSGFFINDHQVITNFHVVDGTDDVRVYSSVWGQLNPAQLVADSGGTNPDDFAVLDIPSGSGQLPTKLSYKAERMDSVIAAGFPAYLADSDAEFRRLLKGERVTNLTPYPVTGIVSAIYDDAEKKVPVIVTTAQIGHGSSGGPLFDACGRVLGVNTYGRSAGAGENANYALTSQRLGKFLETKRISFIADESDCTPAVASIAAAPPPEATQEPTAPTEQDRRKLEAAPGLQ